MPGVVHDGMVVRAPNLDWNDVEVLHEVQLEPAPLGPTLENEANLAALGELWFGGNRGLTDFVHVSGEIGIGGGIVVGGELFRGRNGMAGELGHIVLDPSGPECSCGGRGCLERLAGQEAILAGAGASSRQELETRCAEGDKRARAAVALAGRRIGIALASVVNLLDTDAVVLGGAFAGLAEWLGPAMQKSLALHVSSPHADTPIFTSTLGTDAAVRGAAGSVVRRVLTDPAGYVAVQQTGVA